MRRRRLAGIGAILSTVGVLAGALLWSRRDPWPARVVIVPFDSVGSVPQGFSASGRLFETSGFDGLTSWDVETGRRSGMPTLPVIWRKSYNSDRTSFVGVVRSSQIQGGWEVILVDVASGAIKARLPIQSLPMFRPLWQEGDRSAQMVLETQGQGLQIVTWDLSSQSDTKRAMSGLKAFGPMTPKALSPDGRILVLLNSSSNGGILRWDIESDRPIGNLLRTATTHYNTGAGVAFARDGRTLIVGTSDGQAEFWNVAKSQLIKTIMVHPNGLKSYYLEISPDGRTLASAGSDLISPPWLDRIWASLRNQIAGGNQRATQEVVVIALGSGQILARSPGSGSPEFSPDGRTIVTLEANEDRTYSIRDAPQPSHPDQ